MSEPKRYPIPEEVVDMFTMAEAHRTCRDACINKLFGWKRASYFAQKYVECNAEAWGAVEKIHPESAGKNLQYRNKREEFVVEVES